MRLTIIPITGGGVVTYLRSLAGVLADLMAVAEAAGVVPDHRDAVAEAADHRAARSGDEDAEAWKHEYVHWIRSGRPEVEA